MKVLVTGARGFLGSAVWSRLIGAGHDVVGVSRLAHDGMVTADLENSGSVISLLNTIHPDVVVNCAARVDFGSGILPSLFSVNVLLPALIGQWCRANGGYLVQASTIAVHGTQVREAGSQAPDQPDTDYGRSKWLAERNIDQSGCRRGLLAAGRALRPVRTGASRAQPRAACRGKGRASDACRPRQR